jgi:hypothetical protein
MDLLLEPERASNLQYSQAMEPASFRRGKQFHRRVQADWETHAEGQPNLEYRMRLLPASDSGIGPRYGRVDIFIDKTHDFVTIVEIKSTDWDHIAIGNRTRLLATHRRQVLRYIDKYVDGDGIGVCAGIIYPRRPEAHGLAAQIEQSLNDYGLQVVWYDHSSRDS